MGLLVTAIFHANDLRDEYTDKSAGILTLTLKLGRHRAIRFYDGMILLAYVLIIALSLLKIIPQWSLLCLITLPSAISCMKKLHSSAEDSSIILMLDKQTGKLQAQFGLILIATIIIPSIWK